MIYLVLGNSEYIPELSKFINCGTFNLKVEVVDIPDAKTAPVFIPATFSTAPKVNVLPSTEISVILLKTISPFVKLSPIDMKLLHLYEYLLKQQNSIIYCCSITCMFNLICD